MHQSFEIYEYDEYACRLAEATEGLEPNDEDDFITAGTKQALRMSIECKLYNKFFPNSPPKPPVPLSYYRALLVGPDSDWSHPSFDLL